MFEDYVNEEEFVTLREEFKNELSNPHSKYKASILNKVKDLVGVFLQREYLDDI